MIATPMYGGMCMSQYFHGVVKLVGLCYQLGLKFSIKTLNNESLVSKARNELAHTFMESDCTHLMWVDADTDFQPESILELLFLDKDVSTGLVPHKKIHWERIRAALEQEDPANKLSSYDLKIMGNQYAFVGKEGKINTTDIFEIKHAGNAFLMTKRKIYEDYMKTFPELWYEDYKKNSEDPNEIPTRKFAFFDTAICKETKHYLSEDYFFSQNVRKMGYKVWACPWIKLGHVGSNVYEGNMKRLGEVANVRST